MSAASSDNIARPPWDTFHIHMTPAGTLRLDGYHGFREPICTSCGEPIPWVLDMMSFTSEGGGYVAQHASCAWSPEAFTAQRKRAKTRLDCTAGPDQ